MVKDTLSELLALPVEERLRLSHLLWESAADSVTDAPLSEDEKRLLDARLDSSDAIPRKSSPWSDARQRIKDALDDQRQE